ncbi:Gibberellin-regulated protein 6, variant 2 [Trifolium repens]|nr:Gibberellin-regulated protein 6, variant 2 [Trifolium repens]
MARLFVVLILVLISISMLQIVVMASHGHGGHHYNDKNAHLNVQGGVKGPNTTSHACSFVKSAVTNACVFPRGIMGTKLYALATTIGRLNKEDQNALKLVLHQIKNSFPLL